jgi:hypothetical protein
MVQNIESTFKLQIDLNEGKFQGEMPMINVMKRISM